MGFFSALVGGVVGFLVGGPVGAVIGAGLGATKVGEKAVNAVMDFVLQPFMPKMPEIGDSGSEADRQSGVLFQTQGSTTSVQVVYGYRKKGGAVVFAETGSVDNKYLYVAYVFSEGLVEGLREVFIDDWLLPVDQVGQLNAGNLVTVNADRYKDRVQMRWYPGVYFNNPRNSTVGAQVKGDIFAEAPSFTSEMVYNGLSVLFCRFEWKESNDNSNPFTGNIPEIQVSILGKRVASLLVDSTEAQDYYTNQVRYSTNPAEILLDYLRNPRYGKGLNNDDIDWTTWKAAARKCNQTVTYVASGIQGPILTLNYVVETSASIMNNTNDMLTNFRAYMPYVQGKYKLKIEDAGNDTDILSGVATIVQTFTKDDIVSDVTYNGIEKSSKYNVVIVTYVDPDQKFTNQTVIYPETQAERQIYIDRDGGRENEYGITLGGITNYAIAKDFARLIFNKQRRQESCVLTVTSKALELEPGDIIAIQSNILNFGTDPWRVISVKINNDMTVDLGCVRNPDDIYPYVRVGEEDIVLPTYVPKGSIIYYPTSDNRVPLGLTPPTYAVFPPSTAPSPANPLPTNPEAPGGGGVGGGGVDSGPPGTTPTTPVPPVNVTPVPPPVPPPFSSSLKLKRVVAVDQGNQTAVFNIVFEQPSDALYQKSIFYWRLNRRSPWTTITTEDRPGPGNEINISITGLPNTIFTPYEFYVRSYASDQRPSINVTNGTFQVAQNQSTGAIVGTGSSQITQVAEGWTPPASDVPTTPVYNDVIDYLAIQPKLPSDPRRLQVKIQQLQNTISANYNSLIKGFSVYYRFRGDTYYTREAFTYASNYQFGLLTFDLAGDFGGRGSIGALQQYEFFVMLDYSDGKRAEKYLQPSVALVEINQLGQTSYDVYGTSPYASSSIRSSDIPATFSFLTTDQDPNNAFAQGSDIVPVMTVFAGITTNYIQFTFTRPLNSKFRGYRIRYREVIPGVAPAFTTVEVGAVTIIGTSSIVATITGDTYSHGRAYEWVVTAKYAPPGGGDPQDATNSLYGKALVPAGDYTWNSVDVYSRIFTGTQPIETTLALGRIKSSFPALPTINPKNWIKKQLKKFTAIGPDFGNGYLGSDISYNATSKVYSLNSYYQLKFQSDSSSNNLVIYRRVYSATGITASTVLNNSKYNTLGAWEKVIVPLSSLPADADGWRTVNVRGPINSSLFDNRYQVAGYPTLTLYNSNPAYGPSPVKFPNATAKPFTTNIFPYYGVGNSSIGSNQYAEFVFVLATGASESTKGLRLTEFYADNSSTGFKTEVDGFLSGNVAKDTVVTLADYNNLQAGYQRNISEALSGITFAQLEKGVWYYGNYGVPQFPTSVTPNVYSQFLQQPTDGNTVY
jgi:hypothetical protein